jgi:hypothetical protein
MATNATEIRRNQHQEKGLAEAGLRHVEAGNLFADPTTPAESRG